MVRAEEVVRRLQELHKAPEWASWTELANGTGYIRSRAIDLFALNLYPSKRFMAVAYEVKVSRADFRRELDDRGKRAPWEGIATETWFAAPLGVIPVAEVPEGWGLIELREDGTWKRTVRARQRETPETWPMAFVAAVARRASDPPPAPLEAWEVLGRKVTVDHIIRLAEALIRRGHTREASQLRPAPADPSPRDIARAKRVSDAFAMVTAVRVVCGHNVLTDQDFRAWAASRAGVAPHYLSRLKAAHVALTDLLVEAKL